jgi:hypothetical protein
VEFLVMALAGLLVGAALGATRHGAPRWVRVGFVALGLLALLVALLLLATRG